MRKQAGGEIIGEDGATSIARALSGTSSLRELDLGNNRMGAGGCIAIINALREGNSTLRCLDLTGAPIPFAHSMSSVRSNGVLRLGLEGAQAMARLLSSGRCPTLVSTIASPAPPPKDAARRDFPTLPPPPCSRTQVSLSVARNALGPAGVAALCNGVGSQLEALDISANAAGDEGATALANLLQSDRCSLR
jgi:hypothetical protein